MVVQFSIAIILITATIVVKQQISSVQNRKLGYNKEHLIYVQMEGEVEQKYASIKAELLEQRIATSITKTNSPITETWSNTWGIEWAGKDPDNKTLVHSLGVDEAVVETMGLQLLEGRDLDLTKYPRLNWGTLK